MPDESLDALLDSVRARVQAELNNQLGTITRRFEADLARGRQDVSAEVERRWSAVLDAQKATDRRELETAVAAARADAERLLASVPLEPEPGTLLHAFQAIDRAGSLSDVLSAIARVASTVTSSAVLLVANGQQLQRWTSSGPAASPASATVDHQPGGVAAEALSLGRVVRRDGTSIAAPLLLDGRAVAVLYAAKGDNGRSAEAWAETIETLARYGAAQLGAITALRTVQAREWIRRPRSIPPAEYPSSGSQVEPDAQSARRYARLLVSEIKLYNEAAVRDGRAGRDLLHRLGPEVERARRLYEERVPTTVSGRAQHFHQELVQTLAGGDASLLG